MTLRQITQHKIALRGNFVFCRQADFQKAYNPYNPYKNYKVYNNYKNPPERQSKIRVTILSTLKLHRDRD